MSLSFWLPLVSLHAHLIKLRPPSTLPSSCFQKIKAMTGAQKGSPDFVSSAFLSRSWSHKVGGSQNSHSGRKTFQKNPGVMGS